MSAAEQHDAGRTARRRALASAAALADHPGRRRDRAVLGGLRPVRPGSRPYDPYATDILNALAPPSVKHWFGADQLGRDVFSRVVVGARDILVVAPLATALGVLGGVALGLVTGYFHGIVDSAVSRLIDALLALPVVIIALLALAALGPSTATVVVVIGVVFAPVIARTVRAASWRRAGSTMSPRARLRNEHVLYILFVRYCPT